MKIRKLSVDKVANVILGAGASRGATCFDGTWAQSPLDADFFDQIDRLKNTTDGRILSDLVAFARTEFGSADRLSMEPFFTQLESLDEFHRTLKIDRGPRVRSYQDHLERFSEYLAAVFRALRSISPAGALTCDYHRKLAAALKAGDTVVSFNYDCIMDSALHSAAGKSWNAESGYVVPITAGAGEWHDHSGSGRLARTPIRLLKVHGSLNWKREQTGSIQLRSDPYEAGRRPANEIVPPVWNKRVSEDEQMARVWKAARSSLRAGPILVVIGYSVPDTDLLSQVLLRVATSEGNRTLTHLIIVNPDPDAGHKLMSVLQRALTRTTTIVELRSWAEFGALL